MLSGPKKRREKSSEAAHEGASRGASFFSDVLEVLPLGIVVVDRSLRILYANRRAREAVPEQNLAVGERLPDVLVGTVPERIAFRRPSDSRPAARAPTLCFLNAQLPSPGEQAFVLALESDLSIVRDRNVQKLASLGMLAAGLAHDLNGLLASIIGRAALLAHKEPSGVSLSEEMEAIMAVAFQASEVTKRVLAYIANEGVEVMECFDVNRPVSDAVALVSPAVAVNCKVRTVLHDKELKVRGDPVLLQQAITNIFLNACQAMPQGGTVTVKTMPVEAVAGPLSDAEVKPVMIEISDTGVGMDKTTKVRLFEPLFSRRVSGRGTGLGLPIAHDIVSKHGGYIEVQSEPEKGSTFRIFLPSSTLGTC